MLSTYLTYQYYAQNTAQSTKRTAAEPLVAHAKAYYEANIGKVKSVSDFVNNFQLFSYAMKAYGLEDQIANKGFMTKVLESDLTSSTSFANTLNDPRYKTFAKAFNFATTGAVTDLTDLQSSAQEQDTLGLYSTAINGFQSNQQAATTYYQNAIANVHSVDDLVKDTKLYDYVLKAYNIDPSTPASQIKAALESGTSNPNSFAKLSGNTGFQALAGAFNFQADGTVASGSSAQTATQTSSTTQAYSGQVSLQVSNISSDTKYYQDHIGAVKSIHDLQSDKQLYNFVLAAYGIDPVTTSADSVAAALESDLSDPKSFANTPGARTYSATTGTFAAGVANKAYQEIASDFNFDANGHVTDQRVAQAAQSVTNTVAAYHLTVSSDPVQQADAKTAEAYYTANIVKVNSLSDLLNDPKLVSFIAKAFGIPADKATATVLSQVLTSDLTDPNSTANTLGAAYQKLTAAFNFGTDGTIDRAPINQAQSAKSTVLTSALYNQVSMEDEAGQQNIAVKNALYFTRLAPTISDAYVILADKTLLSVVQTALDLPSTTNQDIDVQANTIKSKLNLADLQDPTKLKQFVQKYILMYDFKNPGGTTPDVRGTLISLFGSNPTTTTADLFGNSSNSSSTPSGLLL